MLVKICGITDVNTALKVADSRADFIGFVFAPSKRRISPTEAKKIAKQLPNDIQKVGVFVNESVEMIHYIAGLVGLDYVQLHGDESAQYAEKIAYPIIRAYSVEQVNPKTIHDYPCDYLLIDSPGEKYRGGTGKPFDWNTLDNLNINNEKLILAGGLSPDNVKEAINLTKPLGVDVSSGVESDGIKDYKKIDQFITRAKGMRVTERLR